MTAPAPQPVPDPQPEAAAPRQRDREIPPEDRIPIREKIAYGLGNVAQGLQERADVTLLNPIFVLQVGISPIMMSLAGLIYRIWDGLTDLVVGWMSDRTRSRYGRRKPYLVLGAVLMGPLLPLLFFFNPDWPIPKITVWMIGISLLIYLTNTIYNIPYRCILLEITPHSTERTNVAVWGAYVGKLVEIVIVWVWAFVQLPMFHDAFGQPDILLGTRWVMGGIAVLIIVLGLMPVFFVRERSAKIPSSPSRQSIISGLRLTLKDRSFVILTATVLLFTLGLNLKWGLEFYVKVFYVCQGDQALAAHLQGIQGTLGIILSIAGIPVFQRLARLLGKRRALSIAISIVFLASLATWVTYTPHFVYLSLVPTLLVSPAVSAIWVLLPSMIGDVVDGDEIRSGERREGSYTAVFSWLLKFSLSAAAALSGPLVVLAGYQVAEHREVVPEGVLMSMRVLLAFLPCLLIGPAVWMTRYYPLDDDAIARNRDILDARRATALAASALPSPSTAS